MVTDRLNPAIGSPSPRSVLKSRTERLVKIIAG
jgi:hypothetical protein